MAEIHKCGQGWAYCDGNCAICAANNHYITTGTNIQVTTEKDYPPYLDHPKERKKQTNADRYFRNATDEEIASFLAAVNNHRQWSEQTLMQDLDADYAYYLDWLKQEAESDG